MHTVQKLVWLQTSEKNNVYRMTNNYRMPGFNISSFFRFCKLSESQEKNEQDNAYWLHRDKNLFGSLHNVWLYKTINGRMQEKIMIEINWNSVVDFPSGFSFSYMPSGSRKKMWKKREVNKLPVVKQVKSNVLRMDINDVWIR